MVLVPQKKLKTNITYALLNCLATFQMTLAVLMATKTGQERVTWGIV